MNIVEVQYVSAAERVAMRLLKGFVAGGMASLLLQLSQTTQISDMLDLKKWALALFVAFVTGGILALEKAFSIWESQQ